MRVLAVTSVLAAVLVLGGPVSISANQGSGPSRFDLILLRLDPASDTLQIDEDVRSELEPEELQTIQSRDDLVGRVRMAGRTAIPIWVGLNRRAVVLLSRQPTEATPLAIGHPAEPSVVYFQYLNDTERGYEWHVFSSTDSHLRVPLLEAGRSLVLEARGDAGKDLWFTTTDEEGKKVEGLVCRWNDVPSGGR